MRIYRIISELGCGGGGRSAIIELDDEDLRQLGMGKEGGLRQIWYRVLDKVSRLCRHDGCLEPVDRHAGQTLCVFHLPENQFEELCRTGTDRPSSLRLVSASSERPAASGSVRPVRPRCDGAGVGIDGEVSAPGVRSELPDPSAPDR